MRKYRLLREALAQDGRFTFEPASFAPIEAVEAAHAFVNLIWPLLII
jgi:hypothetical protein